MGNHIPLTWDVMKTENPIRWAKTQSFNQLNGLWSNFLSPPRKFGPFHSWLKSHKQSE